MLTYTGADLRFSAERSALPTPHTVPSEGHDCAADEFNELASSIIKDNIEVPASTKVISAQPLSASYETHHGMLRDDLAGFCEV
jgi:hypothetical protein